MDYISISLSLIAVFAAIYYLATRNNDFFKRHEIPHAPPTPFLGNFGSLIRRKSNLYDLIRRIYNIDPDAKYVGIYEFTTPIIILRDLDLIKTITMKYLDHFPDHRPFVYEGADPVFGKTLFTMKGERWKEHRNMLTPTLTSSKIKGMFKLMTECAVRFADFLSVLPENERETEMKALLSRYANDVIASCVYGVTVDSINDPKNVFYVYGRRGTNVIGLKKSMFVLIHRNMPWLAKLFGLRFLEKHIQKFFYDLVYETIESRERMGANRSDVLQLLIDIRNKANDSGKGTTMTIENVALHAFTFYFGGFDSIASATTLLAHMLAEHPDVQARLQQEIDETLRSNDGELTYDAVHGMRYMEAVINETMRLYPILPFLDRMCVQSFQLPPPLPGGQPFTLRPGMNVWIPLAAIGRDPEYFDEPDKFDPDRFFNGEGIKNSAAHFPFGLGQRKCIGERFAMMEMKVLLCYLLAACNVRIGSKTTVPMELEKGVINTSVSGGFWLKIEPRKVTYYNSSRV